LPCIFCIAVLTMVAAAVTAAAVDNMQKGLEEKAGRPVRKTVDTGSVAKLETTFEVGGRSAPVAITVYKTNRRARIQVLTHELSPDQLRDLQDRVAQAIGARIVDRSDLSGSDLALETPVSPAAVDPAERQEAPKRHEAGPPPLT
jgi:hypothetical protein